MAFAESFRCVESRGRGRLPNVLDRMTDAMSIVVQTTAGTFSADGVAFGVRRLSVVDVEGGHQPFASEDGQIWAVQNGELFNHEELRSRLELAGHRFRVALRHGDHPAPLRGGRDGVPRLSFAACSASPSGTGANGARRSSATGSGSSRSTTPRRGDLLIFASELKSLLACGLVPLDLDYEAIEAFMTLGFVPGPMTPLAAVRKLDARPPPRRRLERRAPSSSTGSTRKPMPVDATLEECSRAALHRARGVGTAAADERRPARRDAERRPRLERDRRSDGEADEQPGQDVLRSDSSEAGEGNELADARHVAEFFGTEHHELELSFADETVDLSELVWHLDEPLADLSSLGFLALSELAASEVTVALSGQGADELLGGYRKHRAAAIAGAWRRLPRPLRAIGGHLLAARPVTAREGVARRLRADDPAARLLAMSGNVDASLLRAPGARAARRGRRRRRAARARRAGSMASPTTRLPATLYLDGQLGLVDDMLHYFDRASMAHSLEVRVPFLDHHVVEYCATIPSRHKVRRLDTKHVLKHGARGLIPDRIIDKPKVGFFNAAVDGWFRAQTQGRDLGLPAQPEPGVCGDPRPRRGRAPRAGSRRRHRAGQRLRAARRF